MSGDEYSRCTYLNFNPKKLEKPKNDAHCKFKCSQHTSAVTRRYSANPSG